MESGSDNANESMEAACRQLLEATQQITAWEWDDRNAAALAVIESSHESEVLASLAELLPQSWNHLDIEDAPEPVRRASGVCGGLMAGQLMFVFDPEADPMLFAAWWPWGNGLKFSLRVSCTARDDTVADADPHAKLRVCFGL